MEFARRAVIPGAVVYASDKGSAELFERLGIEFYEGEDGGGL